MSQRVNWKSIKSRIPSKIQTSSKRSFEVTWIDQFADPTVQGETRFHPDGIVLCTKDSDKETCHTYFHEVIHAISDTYDVGLTETQVRKLEKSLYYFLKEGNMLKREKE